MGCLMRGVAELKGPVRHFKEATYLSHVRSISFIRDTAAPDNIRSIQLILAQRLKAGRKQYLYPGCTDMTLIIHHLV